MEARESDCVGNKVNLFSLTRKYVYPLSPPHGLAPHNPRQRKKNGEVEVELMGVVGEDRSVSGEQLVTPLTLPVT